MFGLWEKVSDYFARLALGAGNGVVMQTSDGPGSLEFRFCAKGNPNGERWFRVLFNATGGIEIQVASDENFSDAKNFMAVHGQSGDVNVNLDHFGINLDMLAGSARIRARAGDSGPAVGEIAFGPSPLGAGHAIMLSSVNLAGQLQPCLLVDPDDGTQADTGDNPLCAWVGGYWHRARRDPNTGEASWN